MRASPFSVALRFAPGLLVALLLLGLSGCSQWYVVRSKHFDFYTETEFQHEHTMIQMEYAYAGLASSFFHGIDAGKFEVFMIYDGFSDVLGGYRSYAYLEKLPGNPAIGKNGLIVLKPGATTSAQAALGHAFLHRAFPAAPLWVHEGLAEYVSLYQFREGDGQQAGCFGAHGRSRRLMPTDKAFVSTWQAYDEEYRDWLPATSLLFIDWAIHADHGAHRDKFGPFMMALYDGKSSQDAVLQTFGIPSTAELDRILAEHHEKAQVADPRGLCPLGYAILPEHAPDKGPFKTQPIEDGEIKAVYKALEALPAREGYPPYYPAAVVDGAGARKR